MLKEAVQMPQTANSPGLTVDFLEKTLRKGKNIIYNIFQKRIKPRNRSNNENNENDSFFYRKTSYTPSLSCVFCNSRCWNYIVLGFCDFWRDQREAKCCCLKMLLYLKIFPCEKEEKVNYRENS